MPEKIRKPEHDRHNATAPVSADPAPGYAAGREVQSGGMESVPTMSYSASPVQGAFGLNHFRAWRANRAARKQAAYAASLAAQLNQRRSMADDMASAAAGRRWQTYQRDRRTEDLNELNGNTEPIEAMTFAPDEDMSGPLAAAGSAAAAAQMVQGGGPAADDVDFDGLLPEAPGHRPRLGWQR